MIPASRCRPTALQLVALVPSPEDIADVGAGMFGEMFDDLAAVQVRSRSGRCLTARGQSAGAQQGMGAQAQGTGLAAP